MKKLCYVLFACLFSVLLFGQAPQGLSYQAVAYDSKGLPIKKPISLRISILDSSDKGAVVYSEIHKGVQPDDNGLYSLNIGEGKPDSNKEAANGEADTYSFSKINWGKNTKFLKIEMDASGEGTNYTLVGTNQLMSVPYALYSSRSDCNPLCSVENIKNIAELRAYPVTTSDENKVIYLKGYYNEADGGHGHFIYKTKETTPDTGGIHIRPQSIKTDDEPGRWVRQYEGPINAIYFGIVKLDTYPGLPDTYYPPTTPALSNNYAPYGSSNYQRINNAINYITSLGTIHTNPNNLKPDSKTLFFPSGGYFIEGPIILNKGLIFKGERQTVFYPVNLPEVTPANFEYLFEMPKGAITRITVEDIEVNFGNNLNIGGMHLKPDHNGVTPGAGLSESVFRNLRFFGTGKGHTVYLEGGEDQTGTKANQYLHFENCWFERTNNLRNSLRITGSHYNMLFLGCNFSIPYDTPLDKSDYGSCAVFIGQNNPTSGENGNDIPQSKPNQISFINCQAGGAPNKNAYYGFLINRSENINIENCWFEDLEIGISVKDSKSINIINNKFANAAGGGAKPNAYSATGHKAACIDVENSFVTVERNHVQVSDPYSPFLKEELFIRGFGGDQGDNGKRNVINAKNNSFQNIRLSNTYGIVQSAIIKNIESIYNSSYPTKSGIDIDGEKIVVVKVDEVTKNNVIERINSTITAGETILIRAENADIEILAWNPVTETTGRNIYLSGPTSMTLQHGKAALFMKLDGVNGVERCAYQLVSVTD